MQIKAKANLILTVVEEIEDKTVIDELMLAAEQYINELGCFILPAAEIDAKLQEALKTASHKYRKEVAKLFLCSQSSTRVGIRIHVQDK